MSNKSKDKKTALDKEVVFSVQQVITYTTVLLTIGASIYTFFNAIPKLDELDKRIVDLRISNTRVEERLESLRVFINSQKEDNKKYQVIDTSSNRK